jgi:hypothetical protein
MLYCTAERCQSGRMCRSRKAVGCKPSWVRIPLSPPHPNPEESHSGLVSTTGNRVRCIAFVGSNPTSSASPTNPPVAWIDCNSSSIIQQNRKTLVDALREQQHHAPFCPSLSFTLCSQDQLHIRVAVGARLCLTLPLLLSYHRR